MQRKKNYLLYFLIILNCYSIALTQEYFTDKGSVWVGGSISFSTFGIKGGEGRDNLILLSPFGRVFAARYFMVGPRFQWTSMFDKDYSENQIGMGLDFGPAYGKNEHIIPYLRVGGQFDIYSSRSSWGGSSEPGFTLPIGVGILCKTNSIFAIQIEPAVQMKWSDGEQINIFSISVGFAGVGRKIAVSALGGSGSVHY
jgi:hypothetical protein